MGIDWAGSLLVSAVGSPGGFREAQEPFQMEVPGPPFHAAVRLSKAEPSPGIMCCCVHRGWWRRQWAGPYWSCLFRQRWWEATSDRSLCSPARRLPRLPLLSRQAFRESLRSAVVALTVSALWGALRGRALRGSSLCPFCGRVEQLGENNMPKTFPELQ